MGTTNRQSLKNLAKSLLNRLENRKFIVFEPQQRGDLLEELYERLMKQVLTEEDIIDRVRKEVEKVADAISEQNLTETEAFQSQKRALKSRLGENEIQGFYLQKTLRDVCADVGQFLFESKNVEDVFETDEAIHKLVMETFQTFDESKIS